MELWIIASHGMECIWYFYMVPCFSVCGRVGYCCPSSQGTATQRMLWITAHLWLVDSLLPNPTANTSAVGSATSLPLIFTCCLFPQHSLDFFHHLSLRHIQTHCLNFFFFATSVPSKLSVVLFIHAICPAYSQSIYSSILTPTHSCSQLTQAQICLHSSPGS